MQAEGNRYVQVVPDVCGDRGKSHMSIFGIFELGKYVTFFSVSQTIFY